MKPAAPLTIRALDREHFPEHRPVDPARAARRASAAVVGGTLLVALTACSADADGAHPPESASAPPGAAAQAGDAARQGAATGRDAASAAAAFAACLRAEGIAAQFADDGMGFVMVRHDGYLTPGEGRGGGDPADPTAPVFEFADADGVTWAAPVDARFFVDDVVAQDAWEACQAEHPDFEQPTFGEFVMDDETQRELAAMRESALDFARRARDAGFTTIADPADGHVPFIVLPARDTRCTSPATA